MFHRKLLSKKETELLRSSRVMLCRNFTQHLDTNFRYLCLEQFFLAQAKRDAVSGGRLNVVVPQVFQPRALPGYPPKVAYPGKGTEEEKEAKSAKMQRLENIVEALHESNWRSLAPLEAEKAVNVIEFETVATTESSPGESSSSTASTSDVPSVVVVDASTSCSDGG